MVADEGVDHAAGPLGLSLQSYEKVKDLSGIRPPVHDVAHLNKVGFAADPKERIVNHLCPFQDFHETVIGPVQIPNGHDLVHPGPDTWDGRAQAEGEKHENEETEEKRSSVGLRAHHEKTRFQGDGRFIDFPLWSIFHYIGYRGAIINMQRGGLTPER